MQTLKTNAPNMAFVFGLAPKGEGSKMSLSGDLTRLLPLMGISGTVKRTVRSTLAAEAYAISEGTEWCQLARFLLLELLQPPKPGVSSLRAIEKIPDRFPVIVFTDSDNLSKSCRIDSGSVKDKRLRIVISMLREVLEVEPWVKIVWLSTNRMIADALTKLDSPIVHLVEGFMQSQKVRFPESVKTRDVANNVQLLQSQVFVCHHMRRRTPQVA